MGATASDKERNVLPVEAESPTVGTLYAGFCQISQKKEQ